MDLTDAEFEERLRLMRIPVAEVSNEDLVSLLANRYASVPVPPCRVCGGRLSVASAGGGNATRYACAAQEEDPANPDRLRFKKGRTIADDHYAQSGWTQHQEGDAHVRELLSRFEALNKA